MADSSSVPGGASGGPGPAKSSAAGALNQKFGPFPLWVYLLAVGVAFYAYEKKSKSTSTSASTAKGTASGGTSGTSGNVAATGAASESAFENYLQGNAQLATTNPQWEANAESVLVGYGYPAVQVQSALNTYLAGGTLSSVQQEIVNAVIEAVGPPPSPPTTNPTSTASPTTAATGTASPAPPAQSNPAPATGTLQTGIPGQVATPAPAASLETVTINGQQYIELGPATGPAYGVSGGAPVYFGNANGVQQGSAAEAQAKKTGGLAYVPAQFANLVYAYSGVTG